MYPDTDEVDSDVECENAHYPEEELDELRFFYGDNEPRSVFNPPNDIQFFVQVGPSFSALPVTCIQKRNTRAVKKLSVEKTISRDTHRSG